MKVEKNIYDLKRYNKSHDLIFSKLTLLKVKKKIYILNLFDTLENISFTKTNEEEFSKSLLPADVLRSLLSLGKTLRNMNICNLIIITN